MKMRLTMAALCAAAGLCAQTRFDNALNVLFPQGTLRVQTESTLSNSPRASRGVVARGEGDLSHRIVMDASGGTLFAYDLVLRREPSGRYLVRAVPAQRKS